MSYEEAFSFEGIDPIEQRFLRRAGEAVYLVIKDRGLRNHEETLDRLDLTAEELTPYLDEPLAAGSLASAAWGRKREADPEDRDESYDDDDDGEGGQDDGRDEPDDDDEPDDVEPDERSEELTPAEKIHAAFRWVRETAIRNTVGERSNRFRVKLYGAKGVQVLATGQFLCRNDNYDLDDDEAAMPDLKIPVPSFEEADRRGSVRGLKALGDYYAQWGAIVLGSVGQLQGVNNAMLARLHRQLRQSSEQVDTLVASILESRVRELEVQEETAADERAGDARHQLAREAINQLGTAASTFLVSRGMSPESVDVFGRLSSSGELMSALQDPGVQELMKDPENLKGLAEMLRQAGQQARAAREATVPNPNESAA